MRALTILLLLFFHSFQNLLSQEKYSISAAYTEETITLDGIDNEVSWDKASMISDEFNGIIPIPGNKFSKNEIKIIYDNKFLYVFAKAYTTADKWRTSLKRDAKLEVQTLSLLCLILIVMQNAYLSQLSGVKKDALILMEGKDLEMT